MNYTTIDIHIFFNEIKTFNLWGCIKYTICLNAVLLNFILIKESWKINVSTQISSSTIDDN